MWKCGLCCEKYDELSFMKDDRFGGAGIEIAVCDNCLDKANEIDPVDPEQHGEWEEDDNGRQVWVWK
jgi:hypothetical protein